MFSTDAKTITNSHKTMPSISRPDDCNNIVKPQAESGALNSSGRKQAVTSDVAFSYY